MSDETTRLIITRQHSLIFHYIDEACFEISENGTRAERELLRDLVRLPATISRYRLAGLLARAFRLEAAHPVTLYGGQPHSVTDMLRLEELLALAVSIRDEMLRVSMELTRRIETTLDWLDEWEAERRGQP